MLKPEENTTIVKEFEKYGKSLAVLKLLEIIQGKSESDIDIFICLLRQKNLMSLSNYIDEMIEMVKRVKNGMMHGKTTDNIRAMSKFSNYFEK